MKITYLWDMKQSLNEMTILANPDNQSTVEGLINPLKQEETLSVLHPSNDRKHLLKLTEVESFESFGHLCKVFTKEQEVYFIQKRLKEISKMPFSQFQQINNTTILNMTIIQSFNAGEHARLEIHTVSKQTYIVSRHYAKQIKEKL